MAMQSAAKLRESAYSKLSHKLNFLVCPYSYQKRPNTLGLRYLKYDSRWSPHSDMSMEQIYVSWHRVDWRGKEAPAEMSALS